MKEFLLEHTMEVKKAARKGHMMAESTAAQ